VVTPGIPEQAAEAEVSAAVRAVPAIIIMQVEVAAVEEEDAITPIQTYVPRLST